MPRLSLSSILALFHVGLERLRRVRRPIGALCPAPEGEEKGENERGDAKNTFFSSFLHFACASRFCIKVFFILGSEVLQFFVRNTPSPGITLLPPIR
jgi:hypothetical protein